MTEYYYQVIVNRHRHETIGHILADDIIYLKSSSPIQVLPDVSRFLSGGAEPILEEITQQDYENRQERFRKVRELLESEGPGMQK